MARVDTIDTQQESTIFTVVASGYTMDHSASSTAHLQSPASDLTLRGFLCGILSLIAQTPDKKLFEADLHSQLQQLDPDLRTDVHPALGHWKGLLKKFLKQGMLHTRRERSDRSESADNKFEVAFRIGSNAKLHLGIGALGSALKQLENGFVAPAEELMQAAGNNTLKPWFGLERLQSKTPLPAKNKTSLSAGESSRRGRKRNRA